MLTGLSSTPIITIVVPLIFSIFTAGGAIYVIKNEKDKKPHSLGFKSTFLGLQLLSFTVGFSLGVWTGVQLKIKPDVIWSSNVLENPVYADMRFTDSRMLLAAMKLDALMIHSGLKTEQRKEIFENLEKAQKKRSEHIKERVLVTDDLVTILSMPMVKETHKAANDVLELISNIEGDLLLSEDQSNKVEIIKEKATAVLSQDSIKVAGEAEHLLEDYKNKLTEVQKYSLLSDEEVESINSLLGEIRKDNDVLGVTSKREGIVAEHFDKKFMIHGG